MDRNLQHQQVDQNYDAFQRVLSTLLLGHRNEFALMRDREIVGFFDKPGAAYSDGMRRFPDQLFSIQEVTDEPIDLGLYSHVAN
ncbi:MAG: hypothetical protein JF608_13780 [Sphingomonadales bacterium]|jgi:hypothetical protein|nr:hypothetical protein [Sphingomonadales bacterium]